MNCQHCGAENPRYRACCGRCYQRIRRTGDASRPYANLPDPHRPCLACESTRGIKAYGFCERCYQRIEAHSDPLSGRKWQWDHPDTCVVPGCGSRYRAMGLCDRHYSAESRRGHPLWRTIDRRRVNGDRPWTRQRVYDLERLTPDAVSTHGGGRRLAADDFECGSGRCW